MGIFLGKLKTSVSEPRNWPTLAVLAMMLFSGVTSWPIVQSLRTLPRDMDSLKSDNRVFHQALANATVIVDTNVPKSHYARYMARAIDTLGWRVSKLDGEPFMGLAIGE